MEDYSVNVISNATPPAADFSADKTSPFTGETVTFTDLSTGSPNSWSWSFNPSTISYTGGTAANSQNPQVIFNANGYYTVSLIATNSNGSDTETKTDYIQVFDPPPCSYCSAGGATGDEEWITNVTFNTIDNSSTAATGYTDYTSISTDVLPAEMYNVSVSSGSVGSWTENYWVFFDWNQDCDFDDANESFDLGQTTGAGTLNTDITIPPGASEGPTRMRVILKYLEDPGSCEAFGYGEVEDYTVNILPAGRELALKAFLEGPFNGTDMNPGLGDLIPLAHPFNQDPWYYSGTEVVPAIPDPNIVDWVLIDARDAASAWAAGSSSSIEMHAAFLKNDGTVVGLDGNSNPELNATISQNLYVVIWQRNHIAIMSNNALVLSGSVYNYDFSAGMNQVYGGITGHKELAPGIWGMFSGDTDRDGVVGSDDKSGLWETNAGHEGYEFTDLNLDRQTDNRDKNNYWVPNIGEGTQVPN